MNTQTFPRSAAFTPLHRPSSRSAAFTPLHRATSQRAASLLGCSMLVVGCWLFPHSSSAATPTPFEYYSVDEVGAALTNVITITPWPDTNAIVGVTNLVVGGRARTYTPGTNGYITGYLMPNAYKLNLAGFSRGVTFGIVSSATTQNIAQVAGFPVVTYQNFQVAQFSDAGTMSYSNAAAFIAWSTNVTTAYANMYSNTAWLDVRSDPLGSARLAGTNTFTGSNTFNGVFINTNALSQFAGSGAAITALNAGNASAGILPDARLSNNIPRLEFTNSWTGTNNFQRLGTSSNGLTFNPKFHAPVMTNAVNYGNAFSSPAIGSGAEAFASGATANGENSFAAGVNAAAHGYYSTAIGNGAIVNTNAFFGVAVGIQANCTEPNSTAIGYDSAANHTNSTALGYGTLTTKANQTVLGSGTISVDITGAFSVGGGATITGAVTNLTTHGRTILPAESDISFGRKANTSLANGVNAAVLIGTNVFVSVSGPSADFTIAGLDGSPNRDGKLCIIVNRTAYNMTVANDSGGDPTAANRIYTSTAADQVTTGPGVWIGIYDATLTRWIELNFEP